MHFLLKKYIFVRGQATLLRREGCWCYVLPGLMIVIVVCYIGSDDDQSENVFEFSPVGAEIYAFKLLLWGITTVE